MNIPEWHEHNLMNSGWKFLTQLIGLYFYIKQKEWKRENYIERKKERKKERKESKKKELCEPWASKIAEQRKGFKDWRN